MIENKILFLMDIHRQLYILNKNTSMTEKGSKDGLAPNRIKGV